MMNGTVLDILIYVFDRYMFDEAPEVPEREALARDLESVGFGQANVERALDWLADLAGERSRAPLLPAPGISDGTPPQSRSLRLYSPLELARLSADCRGLLLSLEQAEILKPTQRELVSTSNRCDGSC
jgi:Smg protein